MKPLIALILMGSITTLGCSGGGRSAGDNSALLAFGGHWSGSGGYYNSGTDTETLCASSSAKITQTNTELHIKSIQTGCVNPLVPVNKWKFEVVGNEVFKDGIKVGQITESGFYVEDSLDWVEATFLASGTLHLTLSHSTSPTDYLLFGMFLNK